MLSYLLLVRSYRIVWLERVERILFIIDSILLRQLWTGCSCIAGLFWFGAGFLVLVLVSLLLFVVGFLSYTNNLLGAGFFYVLTPLLIECLLCFYVSFLHCQETFSGGHWNTAVTELRVCVPLLSLHLAFGKYPIHYVKGFSSFC